MKTVRYDKLVRDGIPAMIRREGYEPQTRLLGEDEYLAALDNKLDEEHREYRESRSPEELADMLEVLCALAAACGTSEEELFALRSEKRARRGGFDGRVFLIAKTGDEP